MIRKGQTVVCIAASRCHWRDILSGERGSGPNYRDLVNVTAVHVKAEETFIELAEWPNAGFDARWFRPLVRRSMAQDVALFAPLLSNVPSGEGVT